MAFCKYCGTQLQEGELCNCEKAVAARTVVEPTPAPTPAPEAAQTAQAAPEAGAQTAQQAQDLFGQGKEAALGIFNKLMAIWKNPAGEGKELVANGKTSDAVILIVIQAVLSGFLTMAIVGKFLESYMKAMSGINGMLGSLGGQSMKIELPYGEMFFWTAFMSLGVAGIFFAVYYVAGMILKLQAKPAQFLRVVALRAAAAIPFAAVALVVSFIDPTWSLLVNCAAGIFAFALSFVGAKAIDNISENKSVYLVPIVELVATVVIFFIAKSMLGDAIDDLMSNLGPLFSMFS